MRAKLLVDEAAETVNEEEELAAGCEPEDAKEEDVDDADVEVEVEAGAEMEWSSEDAACVECKRQSRKPLMILKK